MPAIPLTLFFYIKSPDSPDVLLPSIFCTRMQLHVVTFKPRIKTWQRWQNWQNWQNWVRTSKMDSMYASTGSSPARLEQLLSCWCWPPNNMVLMQCRVRISRNRNIEILEISWNTPATQAVILQNPSNTQFVDVEAWSVTCWRYTRHQNSEICHPIGPFSLAPAWASKLQNHTLIGHPFMIPSCMLQYASWYTDPHVLRCCDSSDN